MGSQWRHQLVILHVGTQSAKRPKAIKCHYIVVYPACIGGRLTFPIEAMVESKHVSFCGDRSYLESAFSTMICSDSILPTFISGRRGTS